MLTCSRNDVTYVEARVVVQSRKPRPILKISYPNAI